MKDSLLDDPRKPHAVVLSFEVWYKSLISVQSRTWLHARQPDCFIPR